MVVEDGQGSLQGRGCLVVRRAVACGVSPELGGVVVEELLEEARGERVGVLVGGVPMPPQPPLLLEMGGRRDAVLANVWYHGGDVLGVGHRLETEFRHHGRAACGNGAGGYGVRRWSIGGRVVRCGGVAWCRPPRALASEERATEYLQSSHEVAYLR